MVPSVRCPPPPTAPQNPNHLGLIISHMMCQSPSYLNGTYYLLSLLTYFYVPYTMKITTASILILSLQLSCFSSAHSSANFVKSRAKAYSLKLRGGQQDDTPTGSYHGNYISPQGEQPKATATTAATAVVADVASPPASTTADAPLASATSKSSKLTNLQERTGPAVLMLGATYLLLKYTGDKGLIGIILLMQLGLYSESTSVVEVFQEKSGSSIDKIKSYPLQKWWWFTTAMTFSGRYANSLPYVEILPPHYIIVPHYYSKILVRS